MRDVSDISAHSRQVLTEAVHIIKMCGSGDKLLYMQDNNAAVNGSGNGHGVSVERQQYKQQVTSTVGDADTYDSYADVGIRQKETQKGSLNHINPDQNR